jgi:signal transduction histidine kinase
MAIEATMSGLHDDVLRRRLGSAVAQIDDTIKEIRVAVYGRQQATSLERTRDIIVRIAADQAGSLGFEPTIELSGPIDDLDQLVTDHLVATVREALTNAAKYAAAQRLGVSVHVDERLVQLRVVDDGIGFSVDAAASELRDDEGGHGLDNIETRAQSLGGTMTITSEPGGGTVIDWTVPRPSR